MMIKRGKQRGSKGQCAQSVRVRPWDITAGCHRVVPFMCPLSIIPSTRGYGLRTTPSPSFPFLWNSGHVLAWRPQFPIFPPKPPAELKPWLQDPSESSLLSFSFIVLWLHGLPSCSSSVLVIFPSRPLHLLFSLPGMFCSSCIHGRWAPSFHSSLLSNITFSERASLHTPVTLSLLTQLYFSTRTTRQYILHALDCCVPVLFTRM